MTANDTGRFAIGAVFDDTPTARAIIAAMPFEESGSYFGGEFYFPAPVRAEAEGTAREVVEPWRLRLLWWSVWSNPVRSPCCSGARHRSASPANAARPARLTWLTGC